MAYKPNLNMTPAEATTRHRELMADKGFTSRYLAGGADERAELTHVMHVMAGVPYEPPPLGRDAAIARLGELERDPGFRERYFAGDADARQEIAALNRTLAEG